MKDRWAAPMALTLALSCGCAAARPDPVVRHDMILARTRLASGLGLLAVEDRDTNLVQLHVRVDVGSDADPPGKAGLAHLVEHLLFEGRDGGGPSWKAKLAAVAVSYNAFTGAERTEYVATAPADKLAELLALEGRRFAAGCRGISQETFEREREVVQNELSFRESGSSDGWDRLMKAIVPPDHPYARDTGGSVGDLASITLDDACRFIASHYVPTRIVVVTSGRFRARDAVARAALAFAGLPRREAAPRRSYPAIRPRRGVLRDGRIMNGERGVVIAWPLPPRFQPDTVAVDLAATNLEAALQAGPFGVEASQMNGRSPMIIARFWLPPGEGGVAAVLHFVEGAVARAARPPSARELAILRVRHMRERFEQIDELGMRVSFLAEAFQRAGQADPIRLELAALSRLTADQVSRATERVFSLANAVVLEVDPREEPGIRAELRPSGAHALHDDSMLAPVDPAEAHRPLAAPPPRSALDRARRFRLRNGLDLVVLPLGSSPLVRVRLLFRGGAADDPIDQAGLGWAAASALVILPSGQPSAAKRKLLAWINADTATSVTDDMTEFATTALAPQLDVALASLARRVRAGQYLADNVARARRVLASFGARVGTQLGWRERTWALRAAVDRAMYGPGHPYARVEAPWERAIRPLRLDALEDVREARFVARRATLIVAGQVDVGRARALAEGLFDDLRPGDAAPTRRPPPPPRPGRVVVERVAHPADTDAVIEMAFPTAADPGRRGARAVLARIVEERLGQVRQVLGASYVIAASHEPRLGSGRFLIRAVVDARRLDEALVEVERILAELRAGGADGLASSFVRARRQVLAELLAEGSGAAAAADRLVELVREGALWTQARQARDLTRLTAADVAALIADELRPRRAVLGLLAPREALDAARRAAGLSAATPARVRKKR